MCSRIYGTAVIFIQIEIKRELDALLAKKVKLKFSENKNLSVSRVIVEEIFTDLSWELCTNRKKKKLTGLILIWQTGGLSNHLPSMSLKGPFPDGYIKENPPSLEKHSICVELIYNSGRPKIAQWEPVVHHWGAVLLCAYRNTWSFLYKDGRHW